MKIIELTGTSTSGGALTLTANKIHVGHLEKIVMVYIDGATGADITITNEETTVSEAILTVTDAGVVDVVWYPRPFSNQLNASAHTVIAHRVFMTGLLKIVIAQGGDTKDFRFFAYILDE